MGSPDGQGLAGTLHQAGGKCPFRTRVLQLAQQRQPPWRLQPWPRVTFSLHCRLQWYLWAQLHPQLVNNDPAPSPPPTTPKAEVSWADHSSLSRPPGCRPGRLQWTGRGCSFRGLRASWRWAHPGRTVLWFTRDVCN